MSTDGRMGGLLGNLLRCGIYFGTLTLILACGYAVLRTEPSEAAVSLQGRPDWAEIARPNPALALSIPEWGEAVYTAWRHTAGGRRDVLSLGEEPRSVRQLRIEMYRPGDEHGPLGPAERELAGRLKDAGIPASLTPIGTLSSKFGPIALHAFSASTRDDTRRCIGFAHGLGEPQALLAGWYCRRGPELVDAAPLACAIDRLSLVAAGGDSILAGLFARAELKRTFCGKGGPQVAAQRRIEWIEPGAEMKLRGAVAGQ